jgi:hypothetical protein
MTLWCTQVGQSPRLRWARTFAVALAVVARSERIDVRMTRSELAKIDEFRGSATRPEFLRRLVRAAGPLDAQEQPSHREAVRVLRERALGGNVSAAVAYERATRPTPRHPEAVGDDELEALLRPPS